MHLLLSSRKKACLLIQIKVFVEFLQKKYALGYSLPFRTSRTAFDYKSTAREKDLQKGQPATAVNKTFTPCA
jgi:hypothetical protein